MVPQQLHIGALHVYSEKGIRKIQLQSITHLTSEGAKTKIHFSGRSMVIPKGIGEFEHVLTPFHFFRIHKSCVVNLKRIDRFTQTKHVNRVLVNTNTVLPVSRQRKTEFIRAFQKTALASI